VNWEYPRDSPELAEAAAFRMVSALEADPRLVLGLPTGHTAAEVYRRVVAACRAADGSRGAAGVRLAEATAFSVDEPVGVAPGHGGTSRAFLERHLFAHLGVDGRRARTPDGWLGGRMPREGRADEDAESALLAECERYEGSIRRAGGLGLTFLVLGPQGQLALNEPGTARRARTRVVELTAAALHANAPYFAGEREPRRAVTIGLATIVESRSIVLLAAGAERADAVKRLRGGFVDEALPAAVLHGHRDVTVLVDPRAASRRARKRRT
jgi:glucosamine-6-phosphate deaminase